MRRAGALGVALTLLCGCAGRTPAPPALTDGLAVGTPSQVGLRPSSLTSMLAAADDEHRDLQSILVARHGRLVVERYFNGGGREVLHDVRSAAKSIISTLVGVALAEGRIADLDRPFLSFLPGQAAAAGAQARVTLRDLLQMRSGLAADDDDPRSPGEEDKMVASPDWLRFALALPMATEPGERWAYASLNTMLVGRILAAVTGQDLEAYAREKLFAPLGFGVYRWPRSPDGHVIAQGNLSLRSRDLLKLGLLFADHGRWQGQQLVPRRWIDEATAARTTFAPGRNGFGDLYRGYGYFWWTGIEQLGSRSVPLYFASGNGGQKVFVIPELDMVVVVTSSAYSRPYAHARSHAILRACLRAAE
jgi:CubicO group peptidase (beta-lactamase class C family)